MPRWLQSCLVVVLVLGLGAAHFPGGGDGQGLPDVTVRTPDLAVRAQVATALSRLSLHFEANAGQTDPQVQFLARGSGYALWLTPREAVLALTRVGLAPTVVRLRPQGGRTAPDVVGEAVLPGTVNYFLGNDPAKWQTNIPTYARVRYRDVYPGVDLVYHGSGGRLEYDFEVAPGADPTAIRLAIDGVERLEVGRQGDLVMHVVGGEIRQHQPVVYQERDGAREIIAGGYALRGPHEIGFQVAAYDPNRPLIIDPVLTYSTYLGGNNTDDGLGIAVDSAGNAYVTGFTVSTDFPTANPLQAANAGALDAFVTKLNAAGSALVYSTYLGGSANETGRALAVDSAGNAYVTGDTGSTNFPTVNPVQAANAGDGDVFVTKLNAAGSALVYSTYLGGSDYEAGTGLAVDSAGNAYVTGTTLSTDFPTANPLQAANAGAPDAFVTKLNAAGSALVYSTYLGGNSIEEGFGIAVDSAGNAYVIGDTRSTDFPTANPFQAANAGAVDAFVTKLNAAGSALVYSTYLGGSAGEAGTGLAVDSAGNAHVTGNTGSTNFPTANSLQHAKAGAVDAFVTKLNAAGSALVYSTYLGGSFIDRGNAIAVDSAGNAYVTGRTASTDFPTANPLQPANGGGGDMFIAKISPSAAAGSCLGAGSLRILGRVTTAGVGVAGVTMTLSGPGGCTNTTVTAANGSYRFATLAAGTYTVTPSKTGCTFTPPSATVTISTANGRADFTASCS